MTKPIKFRKPSNYDVAVAKTGVPFTYEKDGITYGTFNVSLMNMDSKFVQVNLERFARENKEALEKMEDLGQRALFMFINTSLHGWSGVVDEDGKEVPFSRENAMMLFDGDDNEMLNAITDFAGKKSNFKHDPRATKDEVAKN